MSEEVIVKDKYYYFSSERICSVVEAADSDKDKEEDKFQDYQCYICYELSLNIQECKSCERIFCNNCIDSIKSKKEFQNKCPNNCVHWNLNKPHRSVRNFIENIEFYCKNEKKGCKQRLKVTTASQHETDNCDYIFETCSNEGCNEQIQHKLHKQHQENECLYRNITCNKCDLQLRANQLDTHDCLSSLKKEVLTLRQQITTMYTKEQLNSLLEEYIKGISLDQNQYQDKHHHHNSYLQENQYQENDKQNNYEQKEEEEEEDEQEEEQKNQSNNNDLSEKQDQKKNEKNKKNPLVKIFEIGMKFFKEQAENTRQNQQQSSQQTIDFYPPSSNNQVMYPPQNQSQVMYPPSNNNQVMYPPSYNNQAPYSQYNQSTVKMSSDYNSSSQGIPAFPQSSIGINSQIYPQWKQQQQQQQSQNYQYPSYNNNYSNYPGSESQYYAPSVSFPLKNSQSHNQYQINFGCNHSQLQLITPVFDVNKICQCGRYIQRDHYYCGTCNRYICKECK